MMHLAQCSKKLAYSEPGPCLMNLNAVRIDFIIGKQLALVHSCYNGLFMFPSSFSLQTLGTLVSYTSYVYKRSNIFALIQDLNQCFLISTEGRIKNALNLNMKCLIFHSIYARNCVAVAMNTTSGPLRTTDYDRHLDVWCILGKLQANPWLIVESNQANPNKSSVRQKQCDHFQNASSFPATLQHSSKAVTMVKLGTTTYSKHSHISTFGPLVTCPKIRDFCPQPWLCL